RDLEEFKAPDALKVGLAQTLALNPGTSRSGITITAARWLGFNRDAAARISFVMSIPVIAGAVVVKSAGLFTGEVDRDLYVPMVVGIMTSGLSGWVAVWGTLRLIRTRSFMPFVIYRIGLGVFVLVLIATGLRDGSG
nr:hypothetical protein [Ilumatobacter sp.]